MGDTEDILPPSKKRPAGRELSRDNPSLDDEEDASEQQTGTFKKASDEVLASRKIVRVRHHETSSAPSAPSSNLFASICLIPSMAPSSVASEATKVETEEIVSEDADGKNDLDEETDNAKYDTNKQIENKADEADEKKHDMVNEKPTEEKKTENEDRNETDNATAENDNEKKNGNEKIEKGAEAVSLSSFHQLSSSRNAFTGVAGTGFSSSTFSFGSIPKDESSPSSTSGSFFGLKTDQPFGFNIRNSSLFGTQGASIATKSEGSGLASMQEVQVETGEENEKAVFTADSVLFEFAEGGWKERGKGELKVNVSTNGSRKARLVMRARGNYRLILNASIYPDMKLANMEKRGVTFTCMNSVGEGKDDSLSTFALKFKDGSVVEEFRAAVTEHKSTTAAVLKTPENSPNADDD